MGTAKPVCTPAASRLPGNGQPVVATAVAQPAGAASAGNSRKEILAKLMAGQISEDQADALLAGLESAPKTGNIYFHVSRKGAISAYGLQRMPVTLYVEQWEVVLGQPGACSTPFAQKFWTFVKQWEGKEYKRTAKNDDGQMEEYKAFISRKARG